MSRVGSKRRIIYAGVTGLVVLFVVVMCYSCGQELAFSEYEKRVDRIEEIAVSDRQAELDAIVEEGKMNVNYSANAVFRGRVSESFNIKNIKNNHHPIVFEIFDENNACIYTSKKIEPGYEMNSIELNQELTQGTHECRIKVGYAEEGNVSSAFPLIIEVKK